jgi:hypothetical protein
MQLYLRSFSKIPVLLDVVLVSCSGFVLVESCALELTGHDRCLSLAQRSTAVIIEI